MTTIFTKSTIVSETIASKNGITLTKVTMTTKSYYEIYMDGEIVNRFSNEKIAKSMFKDFSA